MSRAEQTAGADEPWMLEDGDAQAVRFNGVTPTATTSFCSGPLGSLLRSCLRGSEPMGRSARRPLLRYIWGDVA